MVGKLDEFIFDSVAGRGIPRSDVQLAEDRADVSVDRARTDHQLFGYLGVSQSYRDQAEHLNLSLGQFAWIGRRRPLLMIRPGIRA